MRVPSRVTPPQVPGQAAGWRALPLAAVLAAGLAAMLGGCATVSSILPGGLSVPSSDGSVCYPARERFYRAGQSAVANEGGRQALDGVSGFLNSEFGAAVVNTLGQRLPGGAGLAGRLGPVLGSLAASARNDTTLIRQVGSSFDELVRCRREELAAIRREVRGGRITAADGQQRADAIRQRAVADAAAARDVNAQLRSRNEGYQSAANNIDGRIGRDPALSARRAESAQVHRTVQTNQRALTTQAAAAETSVRDSSFNVSALPERTSRA